MKRMVGHLVMHGGPRSGHSDGAPSTGPCKSWQAAMDEQEQLDKNRATADAVIASTIKEVRRAIYIQVNGVGNDPPVCCMECRIFDDCRPKIGAEMTCGKVPEKHWPSHCKDCQHFEFCIGREVTLKDAIECGFAET